MYKSQSFCLKCGMLFCNVYIDVNCEEKYVSFHLADHILTVRYFCNHHTIKREQSVKSTSAIGIRFVLLVHVHGQLVSPFLSSVSWCAEVMTGSSRVLSAVLTVATVLVLTMLSLLCLRCRRKKSKCLFQIELCVCVCRFVTTFCRRNISRLSISFQSI